MSAEMQVTLWGIAAISPLCINLMANRDADAVGFSVMLFLIWVLCIVLWALYPVPDCVDLYPLIDGMAAVVCYRAWKTRPRAWKQVLGALFVLQLVLDTAYAIAYAQHPMPPVFAFYRKATNVICALELLCAATPGGVHVAGGIFGDLSHRFRRIHHARHFARRP